MDQLPENLLPIKSDRPLLGDLCGFVLVVILAVIAIWGWGFDLAAIGSLVGGDEFAGENIIASLGEIGNQSASAVLVISMAWALSLSYGAVDLSIFSVAALGGLVSAVLINVGVSPMLSFGAGALAGAAIGAINGILIGRIPVWSFIITGAVGLVLMLGMLLVTRTPAVHVPVDAFESLLVVVDSQDLKGNVQKVSLPLGVSRRLIVASIYILVIVVLSNSIGVRDARKGQSSRPKKRIALCGSGALAGLGGSLWLIDYGNAPVLTRPVGALLPVAAALVAGAVLYKSPRRGALTMVTLVAALIAATFWQQKVWIYPLAGWNMQLVLLIVMILVAHLAIRRASSKVSTGSVLRWLIVSLTCGGLVVACLSATFSNGSLRVIIFRAGLTLWLIGAAALAVQVFSSRKKGRPICEPMEAGS